MAEILTLAKDGALKTQIMYRANLSFAQLNEYLKLLTELKLLEIINANEKTIYKTTEKGIQYLQNYKEMVELLQSEKNKNNPKCNPPILWLKKTPYLNNHK
jgi:predicted transcriptional regulator